VDRVGGGGCFLPSTLLSNNPPVTGDGLHLSPGAFPFDLTATQRPRRYTQQTRETRRVRRVFKDVSGGGAADATPVFICLTVSMENALTAICCSATQVVHRPAICNVMSRDSASPSFGEGADCCFIQGMKDALLSPPWGQESGEGGQPCLHNFLMHLFLSVKHVGIFVY